MNQFAALLRGINVSGKNKIAMADLKKGFEALGFADVRTYLNSGNVLFSCGCEDTGSLSEMIETMIHERFGLEIPVLIISITGLADILDHAPKWWGSDDPGIYDNLIFILPPADFNEIYGEIGEVKEGLEQIMSYENVIFWSFDRKQYQKTNWWPKTAGSEAGRKLTIRTANTVRKLAGMR